MDNWFEIKNYLTDNGFKITAEGESRFFGDRYVDLKMGDTRIRLSISRSFFNVEFFSRSHPKDAYDIEIVMAYFSKPYSGENEIPFLRNHLPEVMHLFSTSYFPIAKPQLDKLGMERAGRLFPGLF